MEDTEAMAIAITTGVCLMCRSSSFPRQLQLRLPAPLPVLQPPIEVASLVQQLRQQQLAVGSAARAFELAQEGYRVGLSQQIPMLTAEGTLRAARQHMAVLAAR